MIRVDCNQGSPEWIAARVGIPTASQFHRIITPKTMKLSAASDSYLHELLAEWMLGAALDTYSSEWMQRGHEIEESAVQYYEMQRDLETEQIGFCLRDDRMVGCSPDRLVGEDGGLEIKCPSPQVHVGYLLGMEEQYRCQVQGALWVTGRAWWDLMSYHPTLPPALVRFERDEEFIALLEELVAQFCDRLEGGKRLLISKGYVEREVAV